MNSIWIARNQDGILLVFNKKPTRSATPAGVKHWTYWNKEDGYFECQKVPGTWFPEITWESEPIELVIKEKEDK